MRLDEIKEEYGDSVRIDWRSFLLRAEPEPRPMDKFISYTKSWERPAEMEPRAKFQQWSGEHEPPSYSVPSAVAGKIAAEQGNDAYHQFSQRVFESYFTENRTVSDRDVLSAIASEAGLDQGQFDQAWDERFKELQKSVFDDYLFAVNSQITGVPAVVVDRTWLLPGAVDTDNYRVNIAEARKKRLGA